MIRSDLKERILRAIEEHRAEILEFTQRLIQIESVTGREGPIQSFISTSLQEMGLSVDEFVPDLEELKSHPAFLPIEGLDFAGRPNVVGVYRGSGTGRSLLLNGHVDTIPLGPPDAWTHAPLSGTVADGRIFGRGASDMKSGLAAMTMAVKILLAAGLRPRGDIVLEYVVDEEMTGYGTLACILRGYRADGGISLETSDLCVQPACIGRLWFTVTLKGRGASISRRWEGVSAIEKGIKIVQAIQDLEQMRWEDLRHPLYPDPRTALPCAVCMFQSGMFPSAIPDTAVLRGSLGLMPQESRQEVERQFCAQITRAAEADPWLRNHPPVVEFKKTGGQGAEISSNDPIVCTVKDAFQTITGTPPTISGRTGGADTRYLITHGQTPTVIFGPGMTSEMHAIDESVPIDNVLLAVKTLAVTIAEWSGVEGLDA